jgi:hypothetical protein
MQPKRRAQPLRNGHAVSRKTARKPTRKLAGRKANAKRPELTPEQRYPEILHLPFVKYVGQSEKHGHQCDYWAVETPADGIEAELLGRYYALLTAQFMHEDAKRDRPSILPRIIGSIVEKGKFWGSRDGKKHDPVAIGFAACIGSIMSWAYGSGTVHSMAMALARHYEHHAKESKGRDVRTLLAKHSQQYRDFADASRKRDQEVRP